MFNKELLFGVFDLYKIETVVKDGPAQEANGIGMCTFRRDNKVSAVSGTPMGVMAYTGKFDIKEDQLVVQVESCVVKEWVGTPIARKILKLDSESLVIEVSSPDQTICSKLYWKKAVSL